MGDVMRHNEQEMLVKDFYIKSIIDAISISPAVIACILIAYKLYHGLI